LSPLGPTGGRRCLPRVTPCHFAEQRVGAEMRAARHASIVTVAIARPPAFPRRTPWRSQLPRRPVHGTFRLRCLAQRRCAEISVGQLTLHPAWRSAPNQAIAEISAMTKTINLASVSLFISQCGLSAKSRDHHGTAGQAKNAVSPRHFDRSRSVPPQPKDASCGRGLGWASLRSIAQGALRL
jgi:hypothetical protein